MSIIKKIHQDLGEIQVNILVNPNTSKEVVAIFQSGKTVFLEIEKIEEFKKIINEIK
jgi:hypothetical protein